MVHRLHAAQRSRWAAWVWAEANGRSLLGNGGRALVEQGVVLARLIPLYRALSSVKVMDGRTVSFWMDRWLPCGPIAAAFLAPFSHSVSVEVTVWQVRADWLRRHLVPRLTRVQSVKGSRRVGTSWSSPARLQRRAGDMLASRSMAQRLTAWICWLLRRAQLSALPETSPCSIIGTCGNIGMRLYSKGSGPLSLGCCGAAGKTLSCGVGA